MHDFRFLKGTSVSRWLKFTTNQQVDNEYSLIIFTVNHLEMKNHTNVMIYNIIDVTTENYNLNKHELQLQIPNTFSIVHFDTELVHKR